MPAVPKLQQVQHIDAREKYLICLFIVPYFAPVLTSNKTTKQATASGCWDSVFKEHCKTFVFPSLHFQCLTHTEKALNDFLPVTQARQRCRARDTYITMTIAKYVCIIHFRRFDYC